MAAEKCGYPYCTEVEGETCYRWISGQCPGPDAFGNLPDADTSCPNDGKLQWVPHCPLCGGYHSPPNEPDYEHSQS